MKYNWGSGELREKDKNKTGCKWGGFSLMDVWASTEIGEEKKFRKEKD
jgi:hypothetical protein